MRRDPNDLEKHQDRSDRDRWPDQPSLDRGAGADPERSWGKRDAPRSERPPPRDRASERVEHQVREIAKRSRRHSVRVPTARCASRNRTADCAFRCAPVCETTASFPTTHASATTTTPPDATYNGAAIAARSARKVSECVGPRCVTRSPRTNTPTIRAGSPSTLPATPNATPVRETRAFGWSMSGSSPAIAPHAMPTASAHTGVCIQPAAFAAPNPAAVNKALPATCVWLVTPCSCPPLPRRPAAIHSRRRCWRSWRMDRGSMLGAWFDGRSVVRGLDLLRCLVRLADPRP